MRKKYAILLIFFINAPHVLSQATDEKVLLKHFHSITSEEMMAWVEKLCSPEFNGRLTGTPEFEASARWVAEQLKSWGIKPAGDNGNYFQWFDHPYTVINDPGELILFITQPDGSSIKKSYSYPGEYFPGMNSGNGEITAEVIFAGFGVTAPELGYDDYRGIDVKGKIVLVNRDVPYTDASNPEYAKWVGYCYHQYKLENAVKHGAKGFLYADNALANPNISFDPSIIVSGIGPQPLADIFAGTGRTNKEVIDKIIMTGKPASFSTGKKVTIKANTTRHPEGRGCNVLGIIEGTDPLLKVETVIIGGHLDAVGNAGMMVAGALDNASGCVDMLGAAKALSQSGIKMKRSILFIFIGGEENGLLGSNHYVNNPFVSKEKTVAYINLDMAGNGTGLAVSGSLSCKGLLKFFEESNTKYIHRNFRTAAYDPGAFYGRPRSDGVIFSKAGYRTLDIGTTEGFKKVYYHVPGDDPDAVTIETMEDVSKLLYLSLLTIANTDLQIY